MASESYDFAETCGNVSRFVLRACGRLRGTAFQLSRNSPLAWPRTPIRASMRGEKLVSNCPAVVLRTASSFTMKQLTKFTLVSTAFLLYIIGASAQNNFNFRFCKLAAMLLLYTLHKTDDAPDADGTNSVCNHSVPAFDTFPLNGEPP